MHTCISSHGLKRSWRSCPRRVNTGNKNTPSTHHPWRRNVTTLMVGFFKKTVTYAKISPKSGEPQRYIAGERKKKKKMFWLRLLCRIVVNFCLSWHWLFSRFSCNQLFQSVLLVSGHVWESVLLTVLFISGYVSVLSCSLSCWSCMCLRFHVYCWLQDMFKVPSGYLADSRICLRSHLAILLISVWMSCLGILLISGCVWDSVWLSCWF